MKLLGRLLLLLVVVTGSLVVGQGRAEACSCAGEPLAQYADEVSVAFAGRQIGREVHDEMSDDGAVLTFQVDRVYKGAVGAVIELRTGAQGSACGADFGTTDPAAVVGWGEEDDLSVSLCDSFYSVDEMEELFGQGAEPDPTVEIVSSGGSTAADPSDDAALGVTDSSRSGLVSALIGLGAIVGVGLLAAAAVLVLRGRSAS